MKKITFRYSGSGTDLYLSGSFGFLKTLAKPDTTVLLTDENVYAAHAKKFRGWDTIVLRSGEAYKVQATVDAVIAQLVELEADRKTTLVGVGGGVITDLAGYVASVYMRGIRFGFVPTTILGLVDASIGGKNGIDVGPYKNLVGIIRQPSFILHDMAFLRSLPQAEWENGFAEIVKHACIRDAALFRELEGNRLSHYRLKQKAVCELVQRNALLKARVVKRDEFEQGERRLLNFGHTLGHALETQYELMHGQAIAIGMTYACHISETLTGFRDTDRVVSLLQQYNLPTYASFDKDKVFRVLRMDKKRQHGNMNFILIEKIGKGVIRTIALDQLEKIVAKL